MLANGVEEPRNNLREIGATDFDKGTQALQEQPFQRITLEQLDIHRQKKRP